MATEQTDTLFVKPDLSEATDRISEGIYKVRIAGSETGTWPGNEDKKPTRFVKWTLETFDEEQPKNNGRKIFHTTAVEGKGVFRLQEFFRAAMGEELSEKGFSRDMLHGREVEVTLGVNKMRPEYTEVKAVRPITH